MEESMTLKRGAKRGDPPPIGANALANDLTPELALAKKAARAAGEILRGYWRRGASEFGSKAHDNPVTAAGLDADRAIKKLLRDPFPGYGWVSGGDAGNEHRTELRRA